VKDEIIVAVGPVSNRLLHKATGYGVIVDRGDWHNALFRLECALDGQPVHRSDRLIERLLVASHVPHPSMMVSTTMEYDV
jgi:hypothetical protein